MLHKACTDPQVKLLGSDDGPGQIAGYAAVFHNRDRAGDIILPGAFTPYLASFLQDGFIAAGHDWAALSVCTPLEAKETDYGLWVVGEFHSTSYAQDQRTTARERQARGKSVNLSIGYDIADSEQTPEANLLKALPLYEWSLVNVPANPLAQVTGIKSADPLAGWAFDDHATAALAVVSSYVARATALSALRAKAGRQLSAANRTRLEDMQGALAAAVPQLQEVLADLGELLTGTADPPDADAPAAKAATDAVRRLYATHLYQQILQGVSHA